MVDAGMRELWQTGYMHNRMRMISASFLVKNLLIDWRLGAQWFWDCLCDADVANNSASWQWIAGCGMDAAPFFRIFNPTTQAKSLIQMGGILGALSQNSRSFPTGICMSHGQRRRMSCIERISHWVLIILIQWWILRSLGIGHWLKTDA